ncbi:MAG: hypothetical protein H0U71_03620 [Gammaproteobacteria bacterium]|nr:hypothetical protein [Gammaproteobacteria bacterium]
MLDKNSNSNSDKIPLYGVHSYKVKHKHLATSHQVIQTIKFYFDSDLGAKSFYQQYDEKFIPTTAHANQFIHTTFTVKKPSQERSELINTSGVWTVRCSYVVNQENLYGQELDYVQDNKKISKLDFLNLLNCYFEIPNTDTLEFIEAFSNNQNVSTELQFFKGNKIFKSTSPYLPILRPLAPLPDSKAYQVVGRWCDAIFDDGQEHPQLQWPYQRRYQTDYVKLLTPQTLKSLEESSHQDDFLRNLPVNPKIVEFGAGAGFALRDIKELRPDAYVIAVGITPLFEENINFCDQIYYSFIPDNLALLKDHIGTIDLVIDVYGAQTYARNVRDVTLYAACLLKEGGIFKSIVSGLDDPPHTYDSCPLGSGINRYDLIQFFKEHLGIDLVIKKTKVESRLKTGKIVEDFYLEFTKTQTANSFTYDDFQKLCQLADSSLGIPYEIDVSCNSDYGIFKSQAIRSMAFFKPRHDVEEPRTQQHFHLEESVVNLSNKQ